MRATTVYLAVGAAALVIATGPARAGDGQAIDFDKDAVGRLPEGWKAEGTTQKGPLATWQVTADSTAPSQPNALALIASEHGSTGTFNICWTDRTRFQDGTIELSLRPISGAEDQGGGPIWRVKDRNNYYICRANPLESNFRVYYVKDGTRKQLASAKVDIPSNQWHTIKIEHYGSHIACFLDGQKLVEADDNTLAEAGGIGLWTKADAVTAFDNLRVMPGARVEAQPPTSLDTARIEQVLDLKGALNTEENVFKVSKPRVDVSVSVDGRPLEPFMGLTSWVAFRPGVKAGAMVMGDFVLFQDEVNPVMSVLLNRGLSVTALHNHFVDAEPPPYFLHIQGEGAADELAAGVRAALDKVTTIRAGNSQPVSRRRAAGVPAISTISADRIRSILGVPGTAKEGMLKVVIGRAVTMTCGCTVGREMGVNTWAAFAGDDHRAIVDGDFVTFEGELQPVLKSLRNADIDIVAIHNHMEGEAPKAIFLHYWGVGPAEDLARGVRAALDALVKAPHGHDQTHP